MNAKVEYFSGYLVTEQINGAHLRMPEYSLCEGDLIVQTNDGTWYKMAPGLAVMGFALTEAQVMSLKPVLYSSDGLSFTVSTEEPK